MARTDAELAVDEEIRTACREGDHDRATTLALKAYGEEILGWLVDRLRSETAGNDAFSVFTEDLWLGWRTFQWRCGARAWSYVLARNAGNRVAKRRGAEGAHQTTFSTNVLKVANEIRATTAAHFRTTIKDAFRELRDKLSEEDQLILVLRVDKQLPWTDITYVVLDGKEVGDDGVKRESARLRKRLQIIKSRLRTLAEEADLV